MEKQLDPLFRRLNQAVESIERAVALHRTDLRPSGACASRVPVFAIHEHSVRELVKGFQLHAQLWSDFQDAIRSHRPDVQWRTLLEFTEEVSRLRQGLDRCQAQLATAALAIDRRRLTRCANDIDGEIAARCRLADRRSFAARFEELTGQPLIDGLTMRCLTFILAETPELFRDLQNAVMEGTISAPL